MSRFYGSLYT